MPSCPPTLRVRPSKHPKVLFRIHPIEAVANIPESATLQERGYVRRLFSTFARGSPGVGLLVMRLVAGTGLVVHGVLRLSTGPSIESGILTVLAVAGGILLLIGLWTPVAGALVAVLGVWCAIFQPRNPWADILLGTLGVALTLLGPGAWSVDARLYGWKRINVRERERQPCDCNIPR